MAQVVGGLSLSEASVLGYSGCINKIILDHNFTSNNYIPLKRVIISEYSKFYPSSFGYLHPEIVIYKREVKNTVVQFAAFIQHSSNGQEHSSMHPHR